MKFWVWSLVLNISTNICLGNNSLCIRTTNLLKICVLKPLVDTSPRVQRLMLQLSQYHMKVQYKAGKHFLLSDCLSRLSNSASQEDNESLNLHVTSIESEDGDFFTTFNIVKGM